MSTTKQDAPPTADGHVLGILGHILLHILEDNQTDAINPASFDPRNPQHRAFAGEHFQHLLEALGVEFQKIDDARKQAPVAFMVPGNDTSN